MNFLKLTQDKLSVDSITQQVAAASCGAISVFIGTTRDNFEDKQVLSLEYEAYESMGVKALKGICEEVREKWPDVENIAIYHRLGLVPVKEASVVIAISSPHRKDAIAATEFCINNVKQSAPIWKKEIYADSKSEWKENKESDAPITPKSKKRKFEINQDVQVPKTPSYLIQIKASNQEIDERIEKYMTKKRTEININNVKEFCKGDRNSEFTCARIDSVFQKRKDSKSHLKINRVMNSYHYRDQKDSDYMTKYIPPNGIEERLSNVESQLSLTAPTPKNIYRRLKLLEDRLLHLESISPEYIQFWDRISAAIVPSKKKTFSLDELNELIAEAEKIITK